jgi:hypothetical protein
MKFVSFPSFNCWREVNSTTEQQASLSFKLALKHDRIIFASLGKDTNFIYIFKKNNYYKNTKWLVIKRRWFVTRKSNIPTKLERQTSLLFSGTIYLSSTIKWFHVISMLEKLEDFKGVIGSRNRRRKENTMTKSKTTKEQTKHHTEN